MAGKQQIIKQNQPDSHQSQAWAMIKFFPFSNRDSLYFSDGQFTLQNATQVTGLVVTSDILRVQTVSNKNNFMATAEVALSSGHLNYQALLMPGDHAMIWLGNDRGVFNKIAPKVRANQTANDYDSGLKFVGRVGSVRTVYNQAAPGTKTLRYVVTFKGFSEFGNNVYYNPLLIPNTPQNQGNADSQRFSAIYSTIAKSWTNYFFSKDKNKVNVQNLIDFFIDIFLGVGPRDAARRLEKTVRSPNYAFLIPKQILDILGIDNQAATPNYANLLHTILGIQNYSNDSFIPDLNQSASISVQKNTTKPLHGTVTAPPDSFNNIPLWSLIQQVSNPSINEIYTTLRVNTSNRIVPHFIARQIPFTSIYSTVTGGGCRFVDLPRWIIDKSIQIGSFNFGTSDAARFNFFQVYGNLYGINSSLPGFAQLAQIKAGNFGLDQIDVARNGSRNMITMTLNDFTAGPNLKININTWVRMIQDWYGNGHMKLNGTATTAGIPDPIPVGDNLELAGYLFHIEGVTHMYDNNEDTGDKSFVTTMDLSNGVMSDGNYAFGAAKRREDLPLNGMEPGYSDTEVLVGASPANTDIVSAIKKKFL